MNSDSFDSSLAESYGFGQDDKLEETSRNTAEYTRKALTNLLQKDLENSGNKESIFFKNGDSRIENCTLEDNSSKKISTINECKDVVKNNSFIKSDENNVNNMTTTRLVKKY